jgi:superfamily II DNA or RNA helicase
VTPLIRAGRYFRTVADRVRLDWGLVDAGQLRRAQLGAAWALCAHETVSRDPAIVVLPTGVGKTLVLNLAPFVLRSRRVLVVTPGRLVRSQVAEAFEHLADLKAAGVLVSDVPLPRVIRADHRATAADWANWRGADVVVGTPNVLSPSYPGVASVPDDMFDLVIFDEAHHLPAVVWTAILERLQTRALLLTATPFRRDGKPLPGELVYTYPLSQAIEDGVYAPVRYRPVQIDEGDDPDTALAAAAARRLSDPIHVDAGSRLLVRTGTQDEARALKELYAGLGVELGIILANTSVRAVRQTLNEVRDGRKSGFVAVGALIEGFDFPSLKIAAYHRPHRSLAPTLQFLGRLSRMTPSGIRGELLAVPELVQGETQELYQSDQDWAELMPQIVDAAERQERETRQYVANARLSGPLPIPPRSLTPRSRRASTG